MSNPPELPEFPSPFNFINNVPITLVELRMRNFSGQIREKPRWWEKVHDADIVAKWRSEIIEQDEKVVEQFWGGEKRFDDGNGEKKWPREKITGAQLDYIFDELKDLAQAIDHETGIQRTAIDKVYQSKTLIPADLKTVFLSGVSILESVPPEEQDWHPGANDQVLDLVHPSLHCFRIGRSPVLIPERTSGCPDPLFVLTEEQYLEMREDAEGAIVSQFISTNYQWLPTDFEVSQPGRRLYSNITSILQRFLPLFERVLSDSSDPPPPLAVAANPGGWYEDEESESDLSDDEMDARWRKFHWPVIHDPAPFSPPTQEGRTPLSLNGRKLQVIIKLANIVLTPERPKYPGGSWHVEGMVNEEIVATGIYYYASDNISESKLAFRAAVGDGTDEAGVSWNYEQSDDRGWTVAFGLRQWRSMNQELGSIMATEDKSSLGRGRYSAFSLSTRRGPSSRRATFPAATIVVPRRAGKVPALRALPQEIWDMIMQYALAGTVSLEEAKQDRLALMEERSHFVIEHNREIFEVEFNMCEH
ncbi:hypothetical protein A0H81_02708 [Grifola frondosa]|uniref:Uncharacterized protein n=1 Tax=Grifola frondosa TaxID=5627 RepID=A0A1C7MKT9_GRIFR|nr:hypothetical protein A0H81_02708 [Grifola frondosa]